MYGALLGALGGFLVVELGAGGVIPGNLSALVFVLTGLVFGLTLGVAGWVSILGAADGLLLVLYVVIAGTPLMSTLAPRWVRQDTWSARPDAVVVLSSGVLSDSALDVTALDRLLSGVEIVARDSVPRLVTTRIGMSYDGRPVTSDFDQRRVVSLAGIAAKWAVVDSVYSTRDEAVRSARLLLPAGARTIVVVTSPMHTRRACATFEGVGFTVFCQPDREHNHVTWHPRGGGDRLAAFRDYLYERLGMLKYGAKGWLGRAPG